MNDDRSYMARALELAALGRGKTSPNPMVGALILQGETIVGEGYHQQAGTPHAEIHALGAAGEKARGGTLYVTLEPCNHHGKTPPCTEAVIAAGIAKVVIAASDPNPLVNGRGIERLRQAGLEVVVGVMADEAARLNEAWATYITQKRPFVLWKTAMTLDGRIATRNGDSRWVSGEASRLLVHRLRNEMDAILVGIETVLADDPQLTTRLPEGGGKDPIRIVLDSGLRIPRDARILHSQSPSPTWVVTTQDGQRVQEIEATGARVIQLPPGEDGRIPLPLLLRQLGEEGITSLLLEGGATVNWSFLQDGLIDKAMVFIAPKLVGGAQSPGPLGGPGIERMGEAIPLKDLTVRLVGEDILVEGYFR